MNNAILYLACFLTLSASIYVSDQPNWESDIDTQNNSIEVLGTATYGNSSTKPTPAPHATAQTSTPAPKDYVEGVLASSARNLFKAKNKSTELVTMSDIATVGVEGGSVSIQPARGWAYVNKPVYLHSDTRPITQQTTILGSDVTITVTPSSYTWNCGDGNSFTTQDAGGTWSQGGKVTCSYTRAGTYTISVDTLWQAQYTVGGKTYPVTGTLTTTSTAQQIRIVEAEAVLKN